MMFSEYAAKSQPQSGFNPANQPAAGVPSYIDNEHNYPFARKDSDKYVAPSNRTPDAQTANARAGQLMFRSDLVRSALTNTPHPDYHPMADSSKSGHQSGQGRGMVKPAYENVTSAEEYDRLAQARNRKTYDAASFCVEGPRRRLKSGPGWEGPAAYRNGEYSSERAEREWSTVVDISIPPPSLEPVSLSLSRSPLSKTPKQIFF